MKLALSILYICVSAWAADPNWMVEYTTEEKCYACTNRYAMVCGSEHPDCNVPDMPVVHHEVFLTRAEALYFLNGPTIEPLTAGTNIVARQISCSNCLQYSTIMGGDGRPKPPAQMPATATDVHLYNLTSIPLERAVTTMEYPQPPKRVEAVRYEVKQ